MKHSEEGCSIKWYHSCKCQSKAVSQTSLGIILVKKHSLKNWLLLIKKMSWRQCHSFRSFKGLCYWWAFHYFHNLRMCEKLHFLTSVVILSITFFCFAHGGKGAFHIWKKLKIFSDSSLNSIHLFLTPFKCQLSFKQPWEF